MGTDFPGIFERTAKVAQDNLVKALRISGSEVCIAAANMIEDLVKEIERKNEVIALAQKKLSDVEYDRDLLLEELTESGEWND